MNKKDKFKHLLKLQGDYVEHRNAELRLFEAACHLFEIDPDEPGADYIFDYLEGYSSQKEVDKGIRECKNESYA
jgi:hypothetical protein